MLPQSNDRGGQAPNNRTTEESFLPPTITAYYLDPKIKVATFVKAVRAAKIFRFRSSDVETARGQLSEADPTLVRTLALARGHRTLEAVENWVLEATKAAIRADAPQALDDEHLGAKWLLQRIVDAVGHNLTNRDSIHRTRAQNLIHLAMIWLLDQRALDPLDALRVTWKPRSRPKTSTASSHRTKAARVLARASPKQLADLSLIAGLGDEVVARAAQDRNDAIAKQARLQEQVTALESDVRALYDREQHLISQVAGFQSDLDLARREIDEQRQLRRHDRASQAGRMRQLLSQRLSLLLSDARDALDFNPPHIDAARQRIESARETINEEIGKLDD